MNNITTWMEARVGIRCQIPQGFEYACPEDFVLDRGKVPKSEPLTEEQFDYLRRIARMTGLLFKPKQCFHNSMLLTMEDSVWSKRIEYVEGFAFTGSIPVHHAWVKLDGKLVDLTRSLRPEAAEEFLKDIKPQADLKDRVLGEIPDGWEYLGVQFDRKEVWDYVTHYGETNSLIDNWNLDYRCLRMGRTSPLTEGSRKSMAAHRALFEKQSTLALGRCELVV